MVVTELSLQEFNFISLCDSGFFFLTYFVTRLVTKIFLVVCALQLNVRENLAFQLIKFNGFFVETRKFSFS